MTRKPRTVRFTDPASRWRTAPAGTASRRLVEGLIAPLFGEHGPLADAAYLSVGRRPPRDHHRQLRRPPAALPGRVDRRPRGQRHGQRPGRLRRDAAGAGVSLVIEAGTSRETLEAEIRRDGGRRAARRNVRIVGGDTKVVEHGKADGLYITTTGIGRVDPRASLSARSRCGRATACCCRGTSATTASRCCWRAATSTSRPTLGSDTRSVQPVRAGADRGRRRRPALDARSDARRPRHLPQRAGARQRTRRRRSIEDAIPVRDEVRGACELLGLDPLHIANEGQLVAVVLAGRWPSAALAALRALPGGDAAALIGTIDAGAGAHRARRSRPTAAPASWTCSSATRSRGSVDIRHRRRRHRDRMPSTADVRRFVRRAPAGAQPRVPRASSTREADRLARRVPGDGRALPARRTPDRVRARRSASPTRSTSPSSSSTR